MLLKKILPFAVSGIIMNQTANAQLFETRSTRFLGLAILDSLNTANNTKQIAIRDSLVNCYTDKLSANQVLETYFDGFNMGLVVYQDGNPFHLLGFWDPMGKSVNGGSLVNGTGEVKTPFNRSMVANFSNESVNYVSGIKNGSVFYFCDCAKVLRKGTFKNNNKIGWWKEFTPQGNFVQQKYMVPVDEKQVIEEENKWLVPAHCMMRNPGEDIKCPDL